MTFDLILYILLVHWFISECICYDSGQNFSDKLFNLQCGVVVQRLGHLLATREVAIQLQAVPQSGNDHRQVVHTRASVTKQYNLVPVAGKRCSATGKVTVGLASHWPCVTDLSGLSTYGLKA